MGWDAGPAGKGEAGPGRATRDASLPQGPQQVDSAQRAAQGPQAHPSRAAS